MDAQLDRLRRPRAAESGTPGRTSVTRPVTAEKAPAKKVAAKKVAAKKAAAARQAVAKKAPPSKGAAKATVAKKAPAKKAPAKKTAAKKAPAKKAPAKKEAAKKAPAKKAPAKKAPAKKEAAKKAAAKKAPAKKAPAPAERQEPSAAPDTDLAQRASTLLVRADEEPWSETELEEVYRQLQGEADRLRVELDSAAIEIADLLRDSGDGAGDDQADAGSKTFEREHEMSLAANTRDMLAQTERAMSRIRKGTYGVCEGCGNPIGKARLLAFPRATLCVSCKQREERR